MRYGLYGKLTAKPGERDKLVAVLLQAANLLKDNPDCLHYIVNTTEEPDVIWVTEIWASKEAHAASLEFAQVRNLIRQGLPLIAATPESITTTPLGGKGL
jgi:quinol monooxygenase YgiN